MRRLWSEGHKVSWWNLQCFDGGNPDRTNIRLWLQSLASVVGEADAGSYLMPGLAAQGEGQGNGQCPTGPGGIEETFSRWRDMDLGLRGGFLWNYDVINDNSGRVVCGKESLAQGCTLGFPPFPRLSTTPRSSHR